MTGVDKGFKVLKILTRALYISFFLVDHVALLSSLQFVKVNYRKVVERSMAIWFLALAVTLVQALRELVKSYTEEALLKTTAVGKLSPQ
jgi:hypothetical protein